MSAPDFDPFQFEEEKADPYGFEEEVASPSEPFMSSEDALQAVAKGARVGLRPAIRLGSLAAGSPGMAIQATKALSESLPDLPNFLKKEPNYFQKAGREFLEKVWTPPQIENYIDTITEGALLPQTENERIAQDVGTNLLLSTAVRSAAPLAQQIITPVAGSLSREITGGLGGDESMKDKVQFGTEFVLDLLQMADAKKVAGKYFATADDLIKGQKLYVAGGNPLEKTRMELNKGAMTASKQPAGKIVKAFDKLSKSGAIDAESLVQLWKDTNEELNNLGAFDIQPTQRANASRILTGIKDELKPMIEALGKGNPEFLENWKSANRASAAYAKSNAISNFAKKAGGDLFKSPITKGLFGLGGLGGAIALPKAAAAGAGLAPLYQGGKILYRIGKSPEIRRHYVNAMHAAFLQNSPQFIKAATKLDEEILKREGEF